MINREIFFTGYKKEFGRLSQTQVDSLIFILNKLDEDKRITDGRWMAYILATIQWETANTFKPITEYGSQAYLRSKRYFPFIGRGFVQLTWEANYKSFGDCLGIDLVGNPQLANEPETAWEILVEGMTDYNLTFNDPEFTDYSLEDFFNDNKTDWVNARKIINGNDKKETIGNIAQKFYSIIEFI